MTREYPPAPLPAVLAVVLRDGRALLVRREREPDRGRWGFPGGMIEIGETVAEAALRELAEETGLRAEAGPTVDLIDAITLDGQGRVRFHYMLAVVLCRWLDGDGVAGDDAGAIAWVPLADLETAGLPLTRNVARVARAAARAAAEGGF